jgi:hypothetical protein
MGGGSVRFVGLVPVVLLIVVAGCSSTQSGAPDTSQSPAASTTSADGPSGVATRIVHYSPFAADGSVQPGVRITRSEHGRCVHRPDDERADMFDCTVTIPHGTSEDGPCFYGSQAPGLLCPSGRHLATAFEVIPNQAFVPPSGPLPAPALTPFALTMSNRRLCFAFSRHAAGAQEVDGMTLTYVCEKGAALYGGLDRTTTTWTAHYRVNLAGPATVSSKKVAVAWY